MSKLQIYYIFKFTTSRLADNDYKIDNFNIEDARKSGELISVGDNQVFRHIRKIRDININKKQLDALYESRNKYKHLPSSIENTKTIKAHQEEIDSLLFVPDVVNIKVENNKHYKFIRKNGFMVNNVMYRRLCCGAGQARQNIVSFVNTDLYELLHSKLMNGLKINKINVAKFNAYYGLYMSATHEVRTPRVCLINDCEMELLNKKVDFIFDKSDTDEHGNEVHYRAVEEKIINPVINLWDGQGLIDPEFAKDWQKDIGLDFTPCQFIIRAPFIKGMLATFDFKKFAKEIAETDKITDYYGKEWDIDNIDVLLSVSQFKMYKQYSSWDSYLEQFHKNDQVWGVSKWNKRYDDEMSLLNYQYIQTLSLSKESLQQLANPTIKWLDEVCKGNKLYTLLFLLGRTNVEDKLDDLLNRCGSNYLKAILYNNNLLNDKFIKQKVYKSIERRINDAKIGRLWARGNYQIMVSDPYSQAEFAFKLPLKGLLSEGEHWSQFWISKNVETVDACRSPMVDFSEHNVLKFKTNEHIQDWYKYLYSGIVYNIHGTDVYRHSDSDWDGDIVYTTDSPNIINSIFPNLNPITYEKTSAPLERLNTGNIFKSDMRSFNSKIGQITNFSTSFISMLGNFDSESKEYQELLQRIKLLRRYIGDSIDAAKGIKMKPFPQAWKRRVKIHDQDEAETKQTKMYQNSLVANKKPYFMVYIYNKLQRAYKDYINKNNIFSKEQFGLSYSEVLNIKQPSQEQLTFMDNVTKYLPVVNTSCTINELCRLLEVTDFKIKSRIKESTDDEMRKILGGVSIEQNDDTLNKLTELFLEYNKAKKHHKQLEFVSDYQNKNLTHDENGYMDNNEIVEQLGDFNTYYQNKALEICSNIEELALYAGIIVYDKFPEKEKDFLWNVCADGLLELLKNSSEGVYAPLPSNDGNSYLNKKYELRRID